MRIRQQSQTTSVDVVINMDGFTMTNYLFLSDHQQSDLQAADKGFMDELLDNLDVGLFPSIVPQRLVANSVRGDVIADEAGALILKPSGITTGTYTHVAVDASGRVVAGGNLSSGGSVTIDFVNITDIPATVSGFVADSSAYAVKTAGAASTIALNGPLRTTVPATDPNHPVTNAQLNTLIGGMAPTAPVVGAFKIAPAGTLIPNYLRANGAALDKVAYAALYAIIGDTYTVQPTGFAGKPWQWQYDFNFDAANTPTSLSWSTVAGLTVGIVESQAVVTKDRVFLIGGSVLGDGGSNYSTRVYSTAINADGTLVYPWTYLGNDPLPMGLKGSQVAVTHDRIYVLGGVSNAAYKDVVYTTTIDPGGTIGFWDPAESLPVPLAYSQVIVAKNRMHLIGGYNASGDVSTIYSAVIDASGIVSQWAASGDLPAPVAYATAFTTKDRVYMVGGWNGTYLASVYTAPINPDGTLGTWVTVDPFPVELASAQAVVTNNLVYILGGYLADGSTTNSIYTAPISPDGNIGAWTLSGALYQSLADSHAIVTKDHLYVIGGYTSGSGGIASIRVSPFYGGSNEYLAAAGGVSTTFNLPDLTAQGDGLLEYYIRAVP